MEKQIHKETVSAGGFSRVMMSDSSLWSSKRPSDGVCRQISATTSRLHRGVAIEDDDDDVDDIDGGDNDDDDDAFC